jgi:hypothetical protein
VCGDKGKDLSYHRMAIIRYDGSNYNPTLRTVIRIYENTKATYGDGLTPYDYIPGLSNLFKMDLRKFYNK